MFLEAWFILGQGNYSEWKRGWKDSRSQKEQMSVAKQYLPAVTAELYTGIHKDWDYMHKIQPNKNPSTARGGASEVPPISEELLTVDGCRRENQCFRDATPERLPMFQD